MILSLPLRSADPHRKAMAITRPPADLGLVHDIGEELGDLLTKKGKKETNHS